MSSVAVTRTERQADWSLRPDGDTYREQRGESQTLAKRLVASKASVTGIAGQRGAGKSSLALHVLRALRRKNGAYTQLIHSPTSYDPRDFLVAVFQQVCGQVISEMDARLGDADTLVRRGLQVLGGVLVYWLGGVVGVVGVLGALGLLSGGASLDPDASFPGSMELSYILAALLEWGGRLLPVFLLLVLLYVIGLGLWRAAFAMYRPREAGLRSLALELSERLSYQSTRSVSAQAGLSLSKLTSGLRLTKSLSDRPLTLPGVAAQFTTFLVRVASVHNCRVVICLDELDKIEDPAELEKLLRGIKGILGHPKTHFILTVSEDALARFTMQRKSDRGIVESAFENIVRLDHVDLDTVRHMLDIMDPSAKGADTHYGTAGSAVDVRQRSSAGNQEDYPRLPRSRRATANGQADLCLEVVAAPPAGCSATVGPDL